MCDDNKTKKPLVTANRKNHTSSETEDAVQASKGTPAVTIAAISVAVADLPNAPSPAPTTAVTKRFIAQRNYVEARKPQPAVEETEKHDGSTIKEQVKMKSKIICAYNEMEKDQREQEMTERREQYNRQVTETHEPEMCLKTRDVGLKQLQKEKEYVQRMEDHLDMLELENTSLMDTVKNQKEEIEHLQRHLQDTHPGLEPSPSLAPTAAWENKVISKKHTSVITEMENTMKSLRSEVSSLKTSKESSKRELEKYKQYYLEELRNKNLLLYELNRINDTQEESHTEHHTKFEQNISASNSLNTRLINKSSCVEKLHQLKMEDWQNLVEPSSSSGSTHAYMACSAWMSGNDMKELSEELSDLKQPLQLSWEVQKKQKSNVGELAGHIIGKPFKKINQEHEIGECDTCRDFETCPSEMSTPVSLLQCSDRPQFKTDDVVHVLQHVPSIWQDLGLMAQATAKPYSEFLRENDTTSATDVMETKIRSLKSMLSKLKVSRALSVLELERYKYLYQEELSVRKSFQYYLNK
ncbi:ankyrin repeat domain-containing protein 26-like [Microtus ochrogaster]|uniref:Ankyrin repeat domain-containing protein 26-like n=1 Tax=Microtus ochrogaster TaxID=79684 RepID=A0ABM1UNT3_MICOH|nr:ankyrin repeat domain-containing protein 26-like [Microtus ochrogaster]